MLNRRAILKAAGAGALSLAVVRTANASEPTVNAEPSSSHWQTVPLYGHLYKPTDFTSNEVDLLVERYPIITLEKAQGLQTHGSAEAGCRAAYEHISARGYPTKVLYYWNAAIVWLKNYESMRNGLDPGWTLNHPDGTPWMPVTGDTRGYDTANPDLRDWWVQQVVDQVNEVGYDGVFVDAVARYNTGKAQLVALLGQAKADAVVQGQYTMVAQLRQALGRSKTILFNGLRHLPTVWNGSGGYLNVTDGAMMEHYGIHGQVSPISMRGDLQLARNVDSRGKIVAFCGWWNSGMPTPPATPPANWPDNITFPLASFLCAAGPNSFFHYGANFRYDGGALMDFPALNRPLGPPAGAAVQNGRKYTREFEHATVTLDLDDINAARIEWD